MVKTIIIMLDAFRKDYFSEENTPFMFGLIKKYGLETLQQPFGFKNAVGFFTGLKPKNLNQFTYYGYDGKISRFPYSLVLKPLPGRLKFYFINLFNFMLGNEMFLPAIDINYFRYFKTIQKKHFYKKGSIPAETIFDIFRRNKIKYLFYDFPLIIKQDKSRLHCTIKNNDEIRVKFFLKLMKKDYDFYYLHLFDVDTTSHHFGPNSEAMIESLKKEDNLVKEILSNFDLERDNVLLWSDHGMVEVKDKIDLISFLPKFGEGYIYFLDSTMARFWFFNKKKKEEVLSILKKEKIGKILSKEDKKILGIDFKNNFYGDEIFLLNSGNIISPCFFHKETLKGMHGYDLSNKKEFAIFITNRFFKKNAKTEDLFAAVIQMMGMKKQETKGTSF